MTAVMEAHLAATVTTGAVLLVLGALGIYLAATPGKGSRKAPRWLRREWDGLGDYDPAEAHLPGPELHHEWGTAAAVFLSSPPPWPPVVARPRGHGGDQTPARVPVAPWRGRRADHQEADANPGGDHAPAFPGAPLLAPVTGDLWPQDVPAAPCGDEAPGLAAHPLPPRRDESDGLVAAPAVTAPGPGDLAAVTAAVKAMDLDEYEASLPACPWATGEFARILAEVP